MHVRQGRAAEPPSRRALLFDAAVAVLLTGLSLSLLVSITRRAAPAHLEIATALLIVHTGCVGWRRPYPLPVLGINVASGVGFAAFGFPTVALGVAPLVALYTVAARCARRRSLPALAVVVTAMAATLGFGPSKSDASTMAGNAVALGVVWFLGDSQRARRAYIMQLEDRTAELERARDELARRAVAEERLRIARELHDVVAHSMGMIAVQAGVGAHVIDDRPEEAKRSLETIEHASRSALGDIRRMLGLMRAGDDGAQTRPAPGVDDLRRLADEVTASGVRVELQVGPAPDSLPAGVDLALFRIVQEALTNVVKHARARRALVSVDFVDRVARVEVVDDGRPVHGIREGHGIVGMRERVAMYRGSVDVGPLPEGGFKVAATIPLDGGAP